MNFLIFSRGAAPRLAQFIVVVLVLACGPHRAWAENRFALVIGNNHYLNLGADHQLQKAVNDAQAVGDALERDGFRVLRGSDLSRSQMVDKLYELSSRIQPGDTALFYFAGHGVALDGSNYLLPADVPEAEAGQESRIANQSLAESDVIASLKERGARVAILMLDACRDNPFKQPGVRSVGMERGFARVPEASGVFSLYSAGFGQSALDRLSDKDTNPNSVFTRVLLPLLTKPGLNLDDLAYDVREKVASLAAQTPDHHHQIPAAYDQIVGGRVYLASASPAPAAEPVPTPAIDATASAPPAPSAQSSPVPPLAVASLEPPSRAAPPPGPPDRKALVHATEAELDRLGCDAGSPTDEWTLQARMALLKFGERAKMTLNVDQPDGKILDMLKAQIGTVCPPVATAPPKRESPPVATRPAHPAHRAAQPRREPPPDIATPAYPPHRAAAPRPAEHHYAQRPAAAPRPAAAAPSCFMFNGQRVCE